MRIILSLIFCFAFAALVSAQKTTNARPSAPAFNVSSIDGKIFDSASLKGKVVVINLWFINCLNCVEEIKILNKVVDEYQNKDVVFIAMATNKKADLEKFLEKNPFKYNIVPQARQTILSFGEPDKNGNINIPFPMHVVINREGKIVVRRSGMKGLGDVQNELLRQFATAPTKTE